MHVPGLIDLQVNGYSGVDFSSGQLEEADILGACRELLASGTTAFLPTMITNAHETYARNLPLLANVLKRDEFQGRLLGLHLEGPFISAEDGPRGAHTADFAREPDTDYLDSLLEMANGHVRLITIAAELPGAEELARHAVQEGIAVSLGHQMALDEDLDRLQKAGAKAITHLGNALPSLLPAKDNPIWAGLANDNLFATVITDSHHVPASVIKCFVRTKGASRFIVVSDAAPLAGMPPGRYRTLGNDVILEENGRIFNPHTGFLVASSYTMIQCMNYLASLGLLTPDELVAVGYYNPLKLIGIEADEVAVDSGLEFDEERQVFTVGG